MAAKKLHLGTIQPEGLSDLNWLACAELIALHDPYQALAVLMANTCNVLPSFGSSSSLLEKKYHTAGSTILFRQLSRCWRTRLASPQLDPRVEMELALVAHRKVHLPRSLVAAARSMSPSSCHDDTT
jgi:hypothetical protein